MLVISCKGRNTEKCHVQKLFFVTDKSYCSATQDLPRCRDWLKYPTTRQCQARSYQTYMPWLHSSQAANIPKVSQKPANLLSVIFTSQMPNRSTEEKLSTLDIIKKRWSLPLLKVFCMHIKEEIILFISRVLQSLQISAIRLCHHLLRGVDSVHLQILLMGTCRQCGSWSVAGHSHRKVIGRDPICAS